MSSRKPYGLCWRGSPVAIDPDDFFKPPGTAEYHRAKQLCLSCPLHWQCQEDAFQQGYTHGTWGGVSADERHIWWRQHGGRPTVFDDQIRAAINELARTLDRRAA